MADIIAMPKLGFDMAEGTLISWLKAEGEKIKKGDIIAEIETDKAIVQVDSPYTGIVFKHMAEVKKSVPVGTPIAVIASEGETVNLEQLLKKSSAGVPSAEEAAALETVFQPPSAPADAMVGEAGDKVINASPVARTMASEAGIDLSKVKGSGPEGRIVKRDIDEYLQSEGKTRAEGSAPSRELPVEKLEAVSRLRGLIGKRMTESKQTIPHFYVSHSYNAANLQMMRNQMNKGIQEEDHLSINDFIVKAAALTLRQFPGLNSSLAEDKFVRHSHIHIGVAVSVENGLMVIVCRDADQKPLKEISAEIKIKSARARNGSVVPADIEGSTFTISNLGMFDVENFTAIINPPEAAILAVGSILEQPVVVNGSVTVGQRMKMTISADHRISDGAEAAGFMKSLELYLEQPWRMI